MDFSLHTVKPYQMSPRKVGRVSSIPHIQYCNTVTTPFKKYTREKVVSEHNGFIGMVLIRSLSLLQRLRSVVDAGRSAGRTFLGQSVRAQRADRVA